MQPLLVTTVFCYRLSLHIYSDSRILPHGGHRGKIFEIDTSNGLSGP